MSTHDINTQLPTRAPGKVLIICSDPKTEIYKEGVWGEFEPCNNLDVCVNGTAKLSECGDEKTGLATTLCQNGQWGAEGVCDDTAECTNDDERIVACGLNNNGTQESVCTDDGWGAFEPCVDPDVCANGTVESSICFNSICSNNKVCE